MNQRLRRSPPDVVYTPIDVTSVSRAVAGIPSALIAKRPSPGQWSVQEVLAHLADNAIVASWRIRMVLAQGNPTLTTYDEEAWAWAYRGIQPRDSLAILRLPRRTTADLLHRISAGAWQRTAYQPERGVTTLQDIVVAQVNHIEEQLRKIAETKRYLTPGQ